MWSPLPSLGGVSIRTRDRYFAAGSDGATKTQCHQIVWRWSTPHYYYLLSTNSIHMRVYRFCTRDIPTGDVSHLRGQLLTGDARHVPMARLYEKSSS